MNLTKPGYYIIRVHGGIEPEIIGPCSDGNHRDRCVREMHKKIRDEDGLFWLTIYSNMIPKIGSYSGAFFEEEE